MDKKLFISKNASEIEHYRPLFEAKGYSIVAHSFLSFSPIEFDVQEEYHVIFFGSPRAVTFFMESSMISEGAQLACIGSKTAETIEAFGFDVAFVGSKSGDPKAVAEEFRVWLNEVRASAPLSPRRVLFPVSDRSLRSVSSVIDGDWKEEVVVYSTKLIGKVVEACDVYVFSSPSNVEGFLMENEIPEGSEVVAWGKSTADALSTHSITTNHCLKNSSFEELVHYLESV